MKKKLFRTALCLILAFTMILGISAEAVSTMLNENEDPAGAEIVMEDETGAAEEEMSAEIPADGDENEVVALQATDIDPAYGLYGGYDGKNSMDDPETAGACVGWDGVTSMSITPDSGLWWIDDYYVGTGDAYYVEETDDFSLKYQVEFHASEDIEAGAVQIVIDASLGTYRDGTNILPSDAGIIPYGTPDSYTASSSSPFNYYYIDAYGNILTEEEAKTAEGVQLVMWNYRDIVSGSNAMVQFLYKDLDAMQIPDMTEWEVTVEATVTGENGETETVQGNTLTGVLDTSVTLSTVTKHAYTASNVSYTPELYTENQVDAYISGSIPEPYASNFDDYVYIVWDVTLRGSANQEYYLTIEDETPYGNVVGWKTSSSSGASWSATTDDDGNVIYKSGTSTSRSYSSMIYVVTAYPKDEIDADITEIEHTVTVTAHPADGYDEDIVKEASAMTSWGEYDWNYLGDIIGVEKNRTETMRAYWRLYKINKESEKDTGTLSFTTRSTDRIYGFTHYTTSDENGQTMGRWIDGTYVKTTTVDDVLYVRGQTETRQMDYEDYYFSAASVTIQDHGYDVWEDRTGDVEMPDGIDQDLYVYAMFADNPGEWELVAVVPFNESGTVSYTFTSGDLARQPYRVKAEHNSVNYVTYCTISVSVTLRWDSPMIAWLMDQYGEELDQIRIENLSGVAGQAYTEYGESGGNYFQDQSTEGGNYSEKDTETGVTLAAFTEDLYDTILQRDNAYKTLTDLEETSASFKTAITENDPANSRVLTDYYLTAYEGYYVQNSSSVTAFQEAGISLPERNDVCFYDLLPYGMKYNGSVQPVAGRITSMNSSGTWRSNTGAWSSQNVTVTVGEEDIIDNWNGTGRTMIIFHLHYSGDDLSAYYNYGDLWYQGYGVYFQAYYDWEDMDAVNAEYNLAAYIVDLNEDETNELLGVKDSTIWKDDGTASPGSIYSPLLVDDLNGDGVTDKYTNMYAATNTSPNVATSTNDSIKKLVRADADVMAEYGTTAIVENGKGYTYEISVTNMSDSTLSDIVIFDNLENAAEDRTLVEEERNKDSVFKGLTDDEIYDDWYGTFNGLTLTALEDEGIHVVVWYNTNRGAKISDTADNDNSPADVLTAANGWVKASEYTDDLADVKAIALDITYYKDSSDKFELRSGESISFQIHMTAPEDAPVYDDDNFTAVYAFNNPAYYSVQTATDGTQTDATDIGDTVRVQLGTISRLTVLKETSGEIPDALKNTSYTFIVLRNGAPLANQEFIVYTKDGEDWVQSNVVRATDASGKFTLRADECAVFDVVDLEDIVVREVDNIFWDSSVDFTETNTDGMEERDYVFTNSYRSPVYLYKTVLTTDLATGEELADAEFTFRIEVDTTGNGNYRPYADGTILYVDAAVTDGSSPNIIKEATTDENGKITLHIGEIIAFFPVDENGNSLNVNYRIEGTSTGDDWICESSTAAGRTVVYGTSSTISNYYKYRSLTVMKDLNDYDKDDCDSVFTFLITDEEGYALNGNHYYYVDADGNPTGEEGTLSDGVFTITGYGKGSRIVIEGLVEGEKYTVTETDYDKELYETVNGGTGTVTMPTYSISTSLTITNEYLLRDLTVQKIVLSKNESTATDTEFEFTIILNGVPFADQEYTVDGVVYKTDADGKFTLKGGETAYFDDIGYDGDQIVVTETWNETYPQVYPADRGNGEATLDRNTQNIQFVNGDFDNIVSVRKNIVGLDETGENYVDVATGDYHGVTLTDNTYDGVYAVDVTFGVYNEEGNIVTESGGDIIDYTDSNTSYPYVYSYIASDGAVTLKSYNGGVLTETLYLGDTIYIAEIGNYTVKAQETDGIISGLYEVSSSVRNTVGSDYIYVEPDVSGGTAASGGSVTLVNDIWSGHQESAIYKLMTGDSEKIPEGSQIVFRVEVYDAASDTWSPAAGIRYMTMTGYNGDWDTSETTNTSGVLTTGPDGKIVLTKDSGGYPWIRFIDDVVSANIYENAEDGQLRIVELLDQSDSEWGRLVGYNSEDWGNGPALNITPADTFVNGNDSGYKFEVEKTSETADEGDTFTFTLDQVISARSGTITTKDDILEKIPGSGVHYVVYDTDSGEIVREGDTDANGQFTLEAGQYAVFEVPSGTVWTVNVGITPGYVLQDVKTNDDPDARIIDETTGLIGKETNATPLGTIVLTVTDSNNNPLSNVMFELYDENGTTGRVFTSDNNGQITADKLTDGTYYFKQVTSTDSDIEVSHNKCIKDMTWTEIIAQAKEDPTVFYGCLDKGCVKSVDLNVNGNDNLFNEEVVNNAATNYGWAEGTVKYAVQIYGIYADNIEIETVTTDTVTVELSKATQYTLSVQTVKPAALTFGAALGHYEGNFFENYGVSTLYYLLQYSSKGTNYWNLSYTGYSSSDPANIYQRSRVRSTLTGDSSTIEKQLATGGNNYYYSDTYPLFESDTCLFASFPTELQNAITPKAIVSDTNRSDDTTYDTLWLPSMHELGFILSYDKTPAGAYTKSDGTNLFSKNSDRIAYEFNETGASSPSARPYWSRSRYSNSHMYAYRVDTGGSDINTGTVNDHRGLSPAFCIG